MAADASQRRRPSPGSAARHQAPVLLSTSAEAVAVRHDRGGTSMGLLRSFRHAFRGFGLVLARERNARVHVAAAAAALVAAVWLGLDRAEVALVVLTIALVLAAAVVNTVV